MQKETKKTSLDPSSQDDDDDDDDDELLVSQVSLCTS